MTYECIQYTNNNNLFGILFIIIFICMYIYFFLLDASNYMMSLFYATVGFTTNIQQIIQV